MGIEDMLRAGWQMTLGCNSDAQVFHVSLYRHNGMLISYGYSVHTAVRRAGAFLTAEEIPDQGMVTIDRQGEIERSWT